MVGRLCLTVAAVLGGACAVSRADPPPPPGAGVPFLGGNGTQALSTCLREVLVQAIPRPLYEASPGWGHTREVAHAVHWKKGRVLLRPEVVRTPRNDGVWRKVRATARNADTTLVCELRNLSSPEPLRLTFSIFLAFDTDIELEQQNWEAGVRLYSGSVRARVRVKVLLDCEAQMRLESGNSPLPDAVFRLRVLKADVGYENLVVEHIGGVGGTTAKVLGDAVHHCLQQWRPSVERNMLARANAAIVRAGDNREVRVSLGNLLNKAWDKKAAPRAR